MKRTSIYDKIHSIRGADGLATKRPLKRHMNGLPEKTTKETTTMYSCDSIYHDIVASAYVYLFENNI